MLERILKQLLKLQCIRKAVSDFNRRMKHQECERQKQEYHESWSRNMSKLGSELLFSGYTIRNLIPEKLDPSDTLTILTDDGILTEYRKGKVIDRYIDSTNWGHCGGMKL